MRRLGFHLPSGIQSSLFLWREMVALNSRLTVMQVFMGPPYSPWPSSKYADNRGFHSVVVKGFLKEHDAQLFVHAPYVLSMDKAWGTMVESINRYIACAKLYGASGVVVHSGSNVTVDKWVLLMKEISDPSMVLLENMPYKESALSFYQLNQIRVSTGCGLCLDTAHAWVSNDWQGMLDWAKTSVYRLIHCNQLPFDKGSGRDRHSGYLANEGVIPLAEVLALFPEVPIVSEISLDEGKGELGRWVKESTFLSEFPG